MNDDDDCRPTPEDIFDWVGGMLTGDYDLDDFWVSTGLESEEDYPDRYHWSDRLQRWCKR